MFKSIMKSIRPSKKAQQLHEPVVGDLTDLMQSTEATPHREAEESKISRRKASQADNRQLLDDEWGNSKISQTKKPRKVTLEERLIDPQPLQPGETMNEMMKEMHVQQFGDRKIIDDYVQYKEEQGRQIDKQTLLRVIKNGKAARGQQQHIQMFDPDWDGAAEDGSHPRVCLDYRDLSVEEQKKIGKEKDRMQRRSERKKKDSKYRDFKGAADQDRFFENKPSALTPAEWQSILSGQRSIKQVSTDRLRQSIVDGVPKEMRGEIWCQLCDFEEELRDHNTTLFTKLLDMDNSAEEYKISKDIFRTLPDLQLFQQDYRTGQNQLFNVLKAYTCYDNKMGYVQGMNYLAALLLIEIKDQVKVFWCLHSLLFKRNWRMIFDHNTPKLINLLELIKDRLSKDDPQLLQHLKQEDLSLGAAFSPVFITLFIYQVPLHIATRISECFILDGEIALVKILLRMLYCKRDKILILRECDLLQYLRSGMIVECCDEMEIEELISY